METNTQESPDIFRADCLSRKTLTLISDQWTPLVIYALREKTMRFSQLLKRIDGISNKMLTQTLRAMERNGIVKREVHPVVPPIVEYTLTPLGLTLVPAMEMLRDWAYAHLTEVANAREIYDKQEHLVIQEETASMVQKR